MKYLILGSAGQIGRPLAGHIIQKHDEVIGFDLNLSNDHDLRDPYNPLLDDAIEKSDFVMFLAFDVGGSKYLADKQMNFQFIVNNVSIMQNVFTRLSVYKKPFIFLSSMMAHFPYTTYGSLKGLGEHWTHSLGGLVARLYNVYGEELVDKRAHVITDFLYQAINYRKIAMLTNGLEKRQFLHVDDCVEALYILSKRYNTINRNINYDITSYEWVTILELANQIKSIFDCQINVIPGDKFDTVQADNQIEARRDMLNYWQPKVSLTDGLKKVKSYLCS